MFTVTCMRKAGVSGNSFSLNSMRYARRHMFGRKSNVVPKLQPPAILPQAVQVVGYHTLLKPLAFTVCFSSGIFACAAIWQYESMRKKARYFLRNKTLFDFPFTPNNRRWPKNGYFTELWHRQTEGQKVACAIIAINAVVFLLWRIPRLNRFMQRYFMATPAMKNSCWPMLLSTFSHYSFFHMATNMYILYSFSTTSVSFFGKEQFVAMYLSAGVVSSFASYLYKVMTKSYSPSLGASGALFSVLSTTCVQFPTAQLAIVFLPFFTISAGNALKGVMALDTIGLLGRWKLFDHAAHLSGALYGIFYLFWGNRYIWSKRDYLVEWWHKFRGK